MIKDLAGGDGGQCAPQGARDQLHPKQLMAGSPHLPLCIQGSGLWRVGFGGPKRTTLLGVSGKGKPVHQGGGPSVSKLYDGDRHYEQNALFLKDSIKPCLQNKGENC